MYSPVIELVFGALIIVALSAWWASRAPPTRRWRARLRRASGAGARSTARVARLVPLIVAMSVLVYWLSGQPSVASGAVRLIEDLVTTVFKPSAPYNPAADINQDGVINIVDIQTVASCFNQAPSAPGCKAAYDINKDNIIDLGDVQIVVNSWRTSSARIVETSPANGEKDVSVTRETIVRFSVPVTPTGYINSAVSAQFAGQTLAARVALSRDRKTITLFYSQPLPASARVRVTIDGNRLADDGGNLIDADLDGQPGGVATVDFDTLGLTRIAGTNVFGYVYDSYNKNPNGTDKPVINATIRVDGFPQANTTTDANGYFILRDMPAPLFFVHVDGSTATNAPPGTEYPVVGKPFHSIAGQTVQLAMDGKPFNIYLPPMSPGDMQTLSQTADTPVGFGAAGMAELKAMFPNIDPAVWNRMKVVFPPKSAINEAGQAATEALVIPVPPDRIPAPLPSFLTPKLVISIQAMGATNFDVPAPVIFPNLDGLAPGAKSTLYSFNHDAGRWDAVGTGTVSGDGLLIITDPGQGVRAPGWHAFQQTTQAKPCDPKIPHDVMVDPVAQTLGLQDYFFKDDNGTFILGVANAAQKIDPNKDPCDPVNAKATPLVVKLNVIGAPDAFLVGLASQEFELQPGQKRDTKVDLKQLLTDANIKAATENKLYGVKVEIRGFKFGNPAVILSKDLYIYRFFDIADDDHKDGLIDFEKTYVDGAGGNLQEKPLSIQMPNAAKPTITLASGTDFKFAAGDIVQFDPTSVLIQAASVSGQKTDTLNIKTPDNNANGAIQVRGNAVAQTRVLFSKVEFTNVISQLVNANPPVTNTSDFRGLFPADAAGFQAELSKIYDAVKANIGPIYKTAHPKAEEAITVVDSTAGTGIKVTMQNVVIAGANPCGTASACASWADFKKTDFQTFMGMDNKTSVPQRKFHFDSITNRNPSDPDPGGKFNGLLVAIDLEARAMQGRANIEQAFIFDLSNGIAHEVGHDLGAIHRRGAAPYIDNTDVMGLGGGAVNALSKWKAQLGPVARLGLGVQVPNNEFKTAYDFYKTFIISETYAFNDAALMFLPKPAPDDNTQLVPDVPLLAVLDAPPTLGSEYPNTVDSVDFGTTVADGAGGQASTVRVYLFNDGGRTLTISNIRVLSGTASIAPVGLSLPIVLPPIDPNNVQPSLSTYTLTLRFDPSVKGTVRDVLRIESNSLGGPVDIPLQGLGISPLADLTLTTPNNNAGGLRLSDPPVTLSRFMTITNSGASTLVISNVVMSAVGAGQFALGGLPSLPLSLNTGQSIALDLTFDANFVGLQRGEIQISSNDPSKPLVRQAAVGTGLPNTGTALKWGNNYVALQTRGSPTVLRVRSADNGSFDFFLAPNTPYELTIFDAESGLVSHSSGVTAQAGQPTDLGAPVFKASTAPDSDSDGLPDDIEFAIGTDPNNVDSDGDGISDRAEILQGTNPLDGKAVITGIIASVKTMGRAVDVCAVNNIAAVAQLDKGVAVLNVASGANPTIIAQVDTSRVGHAIGVPRTRPAAGATRDTPGSAGAVACAGNLIAVADGPQGLAVIDFSDPPAARITRQVNLIGDARAVAASGNVAYVGLSSGEVVALDMLTGLELARVSLAGAIQDVAVGGDYLYALTVGTLHAISLDSFQETGSASSPGSVGAGGRRLRLFVGGGIAYATHTQGYNTFNLSNPAQPTLIAAGSTSQFGWKQIVPNGSGLGVAAVGQNSTDDGPHDISLYDVSNPSNTNVFLVTIPTPGLASAVAIYNGLAYVADSDAGIEVINYLAYDALGKPPTINLSTNFGAAVAEEGKPIRVTANVGDDVQVRNVEFYVDGVKRETDGNFPFEFRFITPLRTQQPSFTLRAKASDTGDNIAWTDLMTVTLTADATPPRVSRVAPLNNSTAPSGTVTAIAATFSEPIDTATLNASTFRLVGAGPDGLLGTSDDVPIGGTISYRAETNTAFFTLSGPLAFGLYRATVGGSVKDLAGNALGSDFSWTYGVKGIVYWIKDADGFWDDGSNWSTGTPPETGDNVVINRPSVNITVTYRVGDVAINRLQSTEAIALIGGRLSISNTSQINNVFTLNGGELAGPGDLNLSGAINWLSGFMSGAGRTFANGGMSIGGAGDHSLNCRTLNNAGTATWTGTGNIYAYNGAVFNNLAGATFDVQNNEFFGAYCCSDATFNNAGTFRKSAGAGTTTINYNIVFNNSGTVDVQSGTLALGGGGTSSSTLNIATGAALSFTGNYRLSAGTSVTGAGFAHVAGRDLMVNGAVSAQNVELNSGTLDGGGTLTVTNVFSWTGGTMQGAGATNLAAGASLNIASTSDTYLNGRTLNNAGTATWTGTGYVNADNGAVFNNLAGATFDVQNNAFFGAYCCSVSGATFNNAGTFRKSAGSGTTTFGVNIAFNNTGTVNVQTGTLNFTGGATFNDGSMFTGAGLTRMTGGTFTLSGNISSQNLEFASGTLGGSSTISGTFPWTGGTMSAGTLTMTTGSTLTISGSGDHLLNGRTLNNAGTATWTDSGDIYGYNGAAFNNLAGATFDAQNNRFFSYCCGASGATFNNSGTFRKSAGGMTSFGFNIAFSNSGTVNAQNGTLSFNDFDQSAGSTNMSGGNLTGAININGGSLSGAGTIAGNLFNGGVVNVGGSGTAGTMIITGNYTQAPTGTLNIELGGLTAGTQFDRVTISQGATLNGALNVTLINSFVPTTGNTFQIMTYLSHTGTFSTVTSSGANYTVQYNASNVTLVAQ